MSRGVNKAIIVGVLGKDPEMKYTAGGSAIANISVATNEEWKDKTTGEQVKKTEWHRIVIFGKLAEIVGQYLKKGSQAYFEGKIQTRKWQDQSGQDRYSTEIVAHEMQMLSSAGNSGSENKPQTAAQAGHQNNAAQQQTADSAPPPTGGDDVFDGIPFFQIDGRYI